MSAKTGAAHSRYAGLLPIEPSEHFFHPIDLKPEDVPFPKWQPSARKRPRAPARFLILIAFCTGVATTLLWESHGQPARAMIANLYSQLGWLDALTAQNRHIPDVIAPAAPSAEQLGAMSIDLDAVGQNVDKDAATIAADREPTTPSSDQIGQEPTAHSTDQTAVSVDQAPATKASNVTVENQDDAAPLQPAARLTEARSPQTLSERGQQSSTASRHDASCFPSASAVLRNHPGGWVSWTLRAPGHEGTMCWYAAARPRVSDHRPRVSDYRSEVMRSEETVGTGDAEFFAPVTPYGRGGSWEGGQP